MIDEKFIHPCDGDQESFKWPPQIWAAQYEIKQIPSLFGAEFYEVYRTTKTRTTRLKTTVPEGERLAGFTKIAAARQAIARDNEYLLECQRRIEYNAGLPRTIEILGSVPEVDNGEPSDAD